MVKLQSIFGLTIVDFLKKKSENFYCAATHDSLCVASMYVSGCLLCCQNIATPYFANSVDFLLNCHPAEFHSFCHSLQFSTCAVQQLEIAPWEQTVFIASSISAAWSYVCGHIYALTCAYRLDRQLLPLKRFCSYSTHTHAHIHTYTSIHLHIHLKYTAIEVRSLLLRAPAA